MNDTHDENVMKNCGKLSLENCENEICIQSGG